MRIQRGNSHIALLHGNSQPRTLDLARDVMQLPCTSSLMDGTIRQGFTPSCRIPTTRAAMTSPCALKKKKKTSQSEGFSTRAHVLCPSVTCAVHSANRTHRAGHVEFHTRVRVKNPSSPNPSTQPGLCPSAGSATVHLPRAFPDRASPSQPSTRGSRPLHGTDHPHAAV